MMIQGVGTIVEIDRGKQQGTEKTISILWAIYPADDIEDIVALNPNTHR